MKTHTRELMVCTMHQNGSLQVFSYHINSPEPPRPRNTRRHTLCGPRMRRRGRGGGRVAGMKLRLRDPERDAGHASALRSCIRPRINVGTKGFHKGDHTSPRCTNAGFEAVYGF